MISLVVVDLASDGLKKSLKYRKCNLSIKKVIRRSFAMMYMHNFIICSTLYFFLLSIPGQQLGKLQGHPTIEIEKVERGNEKKGGRQQR